MKYITSIIKNHIILIITLIAINIGLILLAFWGRNMLRNEVYQKNIEKGVSKCSDAANHLDNIVYYGENIIEFLERDYRYLTESGNGSMDVRQLVLETYQMIQYNTSYFQNLYIACYDGVVSTADQKYESYSPIGREWYESALRSKEMVITPPYKDLITKESVITISKKIKGSSKCVVALDISQDKINKIIEEEIDQDGSVAFGFVLNRDGVIVAHTRKEFIGKSVYDQTLKNQKFIEPYLGQVLSEESGQVTFDEQGYPFSLVYKKTQSDWHVAYLVNKKVINRTTQVYEKQLIVTYIICFVLLNLIIIIYYSRRQKAIQLKDRAELAEQELILYQNKLERIIDEKTESIRQQSEKLQKINTSVIESLADIVEFRDLESGQHINRIKRYTYLITVKALELYPEEFEDCKDKVEVICNASVLHDIGKIGIPDYILLKPSRLTTEEFEIMKNHTKIGDELAERILEKYDETIALIGHEICRHHHERFDGKGYPDGLAGNQIPLCAQIVGLADVYDALIEKRVYKEAYSHEKAIQMILNDECGKFSPELLHCLIELQDDFKIISELKEG